MSTEAPPTSKPARGVHPVRLMTIALLLCATALATYGIARDCRRIRLRVTGQVDAQGSTFYLHPGDNYLTQLILNTGEYEPEETRLVRRILKDGDVFLDVGANIGWYSVHASKLVGEKGQVIAFEPEPRNLDMLKRNVRANGLKNVVVEGVALSNAEGSFKLYLEAGNLGMHSLVEEHGGKSFVNVKTVRLDDYWKDRGDIKLVKIDTEGAEGMILDGMRETLAKQKGLELIVEFAPRRLEKSGYDPDKVLGDLYKLGYKASQIDEEEGRVVFLGTPLTKDIKMNEADPVTNLYLKR
jgi:FkbM family methyltransferase